MSTPKTEQLGVATANYFFQKMVGFSENKQFMIMELMLTLKSLMRGNQLVV